MIDREFYQLIRDVIKTEEFVGMKGCKHHVKGSVYDHSIKVAYLCYKHHKRHRMGIDLCEFVIGALLHDFYLYDWHDRLPAHRMHIFTHQKCSLENALRRYPDLTAAQQDMIGRHMFPLVPLPPKTKAGWLICYYDKLAALSDYFGENKWKKRHRARAN